MKILSRRKVFTLKGHNLQAPLPAHPPSRPEQSLSVSEKALLRRGLVSKQVDENLTPLLHIVEHVKFIQALLE